MSFIVVTRYRVDGPVAVIEDDNENPAEFDTEEEAVEMAEAHGLCCAMGYDVLELTTGN